MSSPILRGGNLIVTEQGIRDGVRQVMIPLWNAWSFFSLYANTARGGEGYEAKRSTASTDVLDRYLLAKLREFVGDMTAQLDAYEIAAACDTMRSLPRRADELVHPPLARPVLGRRDRRVARRPSTRCRPPSRRSRRAIGAAAAARHRGDLARPHRRTVGAPRPTSRASTTCRPTTRSSPRWTGPARSARRPPALRKAKGLRARLPLRRADGRGRRAGARCEPFRAIIQRRAQRQGGDPRRRRPRRARPTSASSQRLTVNARAAGPRLGSDVQRAIKGSKSGDWSVDDDGTVTAGGLALVEGRVRPRDRRRRRRRRRRSRTRDAARRAASSSSTRP